jgi:hypothetical protein
MRTLRLLNLQCNKTDNDNNKLDKTFLTVDNGRFHILGPEPMINGTDWKINADIQFNERAKIGFFDEDLVRNLSTIKHFRNHIVTEIGVYNGPKKIDFVMNSANYILTYEVI